MIYSSPVGAIEINIAGSLVYEILFIDSKEKQAEIPSTGISAENKKILNQCIVQLDEYFCGKRKNFDLPLRQKGTEFQQRVWAELMQIPYGKTISYLQLAQRLGNVKIIRAAASANGRNQLSIVVPCHRVIGSDGRLTGYGGGLPRKKWLLDHENKFANGVSLLF